MSRELASSFDRIEMFINDPRYVISEDGSIVSFAVVPDGKLLTPELTDKGYLRISYKGTAIMVHRLVYRKFVGPLVKGLVINHIDGDKKNNQASNLEQISNSDNIRHAYTKLNRISKRRKLSRNQIEELRERYKNGESQASLARSLKVSTATIHNVVNEITYTDGTKLELKSTSIQRRRSVIEEFLLKVELEKDRLALTDEQLEVIKAISEQFSTGK